MPQTVQPADKTTLARSFRGAARRALAWQLAAEHGGVVHRISLARHGIDRFAVRNEVAAGRWFKVGRHTVAVGSPALGEVTRLWRAVWEAGSGARLDGASSLLAAGMTGFDPPLIDVTLPKTSRTYPVDGVRTHLPRVAASLVGSGIPRVGTEIAVIHAAQWAATDRQAALLVCLPMQQRLSSPARLQLAWRGVRRSHRRKLLDAIIADVTGGAHSLANSISPTWCGRSDFRRPRISRCARDPMVGSTWTHRGTTSASWSRWTADITCWRSTPSMMRSARTTGSAPASRYCGIPVIGLRLVPDRFVLQVRRPAAASRAPAPPDPVDGADYRTIDRTRRNRMTG